MMLTLRDTQSADYPALSALLTVTRNITLTPDVLHRHATRGQSLWRSRFLTRDDQLIGSCFLSRFESDAPGRYELHIDVDPDHMRQGHGSHLYQDALDFVRPLGLTSFYAFVKKERLGGADFAHKQQFAIVREAIQSQLPLILYMRQPFVPYVAGAEASDIELTSLDKLGDTADNRFKLYQLNKFCSLDIPGRGPFFSYEEYCQVRFAHVGYRPDGVLVAVDRATGRWIGFTCVTHHPQGGFLFNEMTGVLRDYRGRGLAIALKAKLIDFARTLTPPVGTIRTYNDAANTPMLAVNRKLGYQVTGSTYTMEKQFPQSL